MNIEYRILNNEVKGNKTTGVVRYRLKSFILLFVLFISACTYAQSSALFNKAMDLKKLGKFKDALVILQTLLKGDSSNAIYLDDIAVFSCKVIHDDGTTDKDKLLQVYNKGEYLAKKALKTDSVNNAESHYALAFAVGVLNEYASTKQQITNAGLMKRELDKCLALDPHHAGAYHLLGRWFRRLAEFNGVEKFAVKVIYGSTLPEGTYSDAAKAFEKSVIYEPDYILHQYELALTYHKMGRDADAKVWLQNALDSKYAGDDAELVKNNCRKLMKELK